jgi:hypothetical protein
MVSLVTKVKSKAATISISYNPNSFPILVYLENGFNTHRIKYYFFRFRGDLQVHAPRVDVRVNETTQVVTSRINNPSRCIEVPF